MILRPWRIELQIIDYTAAILESTHEKGDTNQDTRTPTTSPWMTLEKMLKTVEAWRPGPPWFIDIYNRGCFVAPHVFQTSRRPLRWGLAPWWCYPPWRPNRKQKQIWNRQEVWLHELWHLEGRVGDLEVVPGFAFIPGKNHLAKGARWLPKLSRIW